PRKKSRAPVLPRSIRVDGSRKIRLLPSLFACSNACCDREVVPDRRRSFRPKRSFGFSHQPTRTCSIDILRKSSYAEMKPATFVQLEWVTIRVSMLPAVVARRWVAIARIFFEPFGVAARMPQLTRIVKSLPPGCGNETRKQSPKPCRYIRTRAERV